MKGWHRAYDRRAYRRLVYCRGCAESVYVADDHRLHAPPSPVSPDPHSQPSPGMERHRLDHLPRDVAQCSEATWSPWLPR